VRGPEGVEWVVGRRWVTRRWPSSWPRVGLDPNLIGSGWADPEFGIESLILAIVGIALIVLVVIPLLLLSVEFIVAGCVLTASITGRLLLGRPWIVEARRTAAPATQPPLEWEVSGWRKSGELIRGVSDDIAAGEDPQPISVRMDG
jgi:hypothetical protein